MDRKAVGVDDVVANLFDADNELKNAVVRIQENRKPKPEAKQNSQEKGGTPKLVPPQTNPSTEETTAKPKAESANRPRPKKPPAEHKWSNPTSILNTRIPPEMDQLLDDHLAKQKRQWKLSQQQGSKPTKQTIVQTALEAYFKSNKS